MQRDLHAVPDAAEIRKQRWMHVLGGRLAEMGRGWEIVVSGLPVKADEVVEPCAERLFRASHIDAADQVTPRQGQSDRSLVNLVRQQRVQAQHEPYLYSVLWHLCPSRNSLDDSTHRRDPLRHVL